MSRFSNDENSPHKETDPQQLVLDMRTTPETNVSPSHNQETLRCNITSTPEPQELFIYQKGLPSSGDHAPTPDEMMCGPQEVSEVPKLDTLYFPRSNSRSDHRLFVRSDMRAALPSKEKLETYFLKFGLVLDCYIPASATNIAYLCFPTADIVTSIVAAAPHCIDSSTVLVEKASPRPPYTRPTERVFVKGIPVTVTWRELKTYFQRFGEVSDVYILKDKVSGAQKPFAFVTFRELSSSLRALCASFHQIDSKYVMVMPAESRVHFPCTSAPSSQENSHKCAANGYSSYFHNFSNYSAYDMGGRFLVPLGLPPRPHGSSDPGGTYVLCLQLIPHTLGPSDIRQFMSQFGEVREVFMPVQCNDVCFVSFGDEVSFVAALNVVSTTLKIKEQSIKSCRRVEAGNSVEMMGCSLPGPLWSSPHPSHTPYLLASAHVPSVLPGMPNLIQGYYF